MICKSVLIVEDDQDIRETLEDVLKMEGYRVFTAPNGQEALTMLTEIPAPSLVLLDLMMPVMDGWKFLETQKAEVVSSSPTVVVVSALNPPAPPVGMAAGLPVGMNDAPADGSVNFRPFQAAGYIKKPMGLNTLLETIRRYCGPPTEAVASAPPASSLPAAPAASPSQDATPTSIAGV